MERHTKISQLFQAIKPQPLPRIIHQQILTLKHPRPKISKHKTPIKRSWKSTIRRSIVLPIRYQDKLSNTFILLLRCQTFQHLDYTINDNPRMSVSDLNQLSDFRPVDYIAYCEYIGVVFELECWLDFYETAGGEGGG